MPCSIAGSFYARSAFFTTAWPFSALRILLCERSEYFISSLQTLAGACKLIMQGFGLLQQSYTDQVAYAAAQRAAVAVQLSGKLRQVFVCHARFRVGFQQVEYVFLRFAQACLAVAVIFMVTC